MKKLLYISLVSFVFFVSCKKQEWVLSYSDIECNNTLSSHPEAEQFQLLIEKFTQKGCVGISLLVDDPINGIWQGAAGFADIENNIGMSPCHLGESASITKTYIAVMIMQLVEQGLIELNDTLSGWIEGGILNKVPNGNEVTIQQLLQHRSGIPDVYELDFILDFFNQPLEVHTFDKLLTYLYDAAPLSEPGTTFYYSDGNFVLLSLILVKVYGSLNEAFVNQIFTPLMMDNAVLINDPLNPPVGLMVNYWDRYNNGLFENISDWELSLCAASSGNGTDVLATNLIDMNKFIRGMNDGTLIDNNSLNLMTTFNDIPIETRKQGFVAYGLGLGKVQLTDHIWYGHFGNHIGSGAIMLYNAEHDISIVVYENSGTFFNDDMKSIVFGELIVELEGILF